MHIPAVHMSAISEENLSQAFKQRKVWRSHFWGRQKYWPEMRRKIAEKTPEARFSG